MKKALLLVPVLMLWAGVSFAGELPYADLYALSPLFLQQTPQQTEKDIKIYPNPVTDGRLTIKTAENFRLIQILNIAGEIVFNRDYPGGTNSEVIELTDIDKGLYLVRIGFANNITHTAKIIIK